MPRQKSKAGHGRPHVGVRVDKADREILKAIAARNGMTVSDQLREIINRVIAEHTQTQ